MKRQHRYKPGDHLVVCDRSGFTYWRSECVKEWNGLLVHKSQFEPRHPQDFLRGIKDDMSIKDARPLQDPVFLEPNEITAADL